MTSLNGDIPLLPVNGIGSHAPVTSPEHEVIRFYLPLASANTVADTKDERIT